MKTLRSLALLCGLFLAFSTIAPAQAPLRLTVEPFPGQAPLGYVEILGVQAGAFNPAFGRRGR